MQVSGARFEALMFELDLPLWGRPNIIIAVVQRLQQLDCLPFS